MAEYVTLESIAGVRLPDGELVSAPRIGAVLQEYLQLRGPILREQSSVVGSTDDPHLITSGRYKGRLRFLGSMDGSLLQFFRYYRRGKYLEVETLRRMYLPHDGRKYGDSGRWVRDRFIDNIEQHGKDALAHVCLNRTDTLRYETVTRFLSETGDASALKSRARNARRLEVAFRASDPVARILVGSKGNPEKKSIPQESLDHYWEPWVDWFKDRLLVEEWLRMPE